MRGNHSRIGGMELFPDSLRLKVITNLLHPLGNDEQRSFRLFRKEKPHRTPNRPCHTDDRPLFVNNRKLPVNRPHFFRHTTSHTLQRLIVRHVENLVRLGLKQIHHPLDQCLTVIHLRVLLAHQATCAGLEKIKTKASIVQQVNLP